MELLALPIWKSVIVCYYIKKQDIDSAVISLHFPALLYCFASYTSYHRRRLLVLFQLNEELWHSEVKLHSENLWPQRERQNRFYHIFVFANVFLLMLLFSICYLGQLFSILVKQFSGHLLHQKKWCDHLFSLCWCVSWSFCHDNLRLHGVRNPTPCFANRPRACVLHGPTTFQCAAFSCDLFRLWHFSHPSTEVFRKVQHREDELEICGLQRQSETTWWNLKNKVNGQLSLILIWFITVRKSTEFRNSFFTPFANWRDCSWTINR